MYRLNVDARKLKVLMDVAKLPSSGANVMFGPLVRDAAELVRTRVVYNLSGHPVMFEGTGFRVRVVTGALRGSIETQWPYAGSALQARVFVNGTHTAAEGKFGGIVRARPVSDYASAVEYGHGPIDLKRTMRGKIVPFFAARSKATGGSPYATRPVIPVMEGHAGMGDFFHNPDFDKKLARRGKQPMYFEKKGRKTAPEGKGGGAYYIAFRRVGSKGWIIPAKEPRPFMRAAFAQTQTQVRRQMVREGADIIRAAIG